MTARAQGEGAEVVLVGAEYEENLSVRVLATALRGRGRSVRIVPFNEAGEAGRAAAAIRAHAPAAVGLSVAFQHRARDFLGLAALLRRGGYAGHVCMGGHFPTATWREVLARHPEVDTVLCHDAEESLPALVERLGDRAAWGEVPGLARRADDGGIAFTPPAPAPRDLDALPLPAREGAPHVHVGKVFTALVGSRGCYGDCSFCAINSYCRSRPGPRLRMRSPAGIAREMADLYAGKEARIFCFHDDTWLLKSRRLSEERTGELAARLRALGVGRIAVVAKARPDAVSAGLLASLREQLGLARVYIGIENFSPRGLADLGRRMTVEQVDAGLRACVEAGVYCCYNLLLFEPDMALEDVAVNVDGAARFPSVPFNFCRAEAYNGTRLWRELASAGRLRGDYLSADYEIADPRAERLFRIVAQAFKDRNFAHDALANFSSSLGYEATILGHFAEGEPAARRARALRAEVDRCAERINGDTIARLRDAVRFVERGGWKSERDVVDFTIDLATGVNFSGAALHREVLRLRGEIAAEAARGA